MVYIIGQEEEPMVYFTSGGICQGIVWSAFFRLIEVMDIEAELQREWVFMFDVI